MKLALLHAFWVVKEYPVLFLQGDIPFFELQNKLHASNFSSGIAMFKRTRG